MCSYAILPLYALVTQVLGTTTLYINVFSNRATLNSLILVISFSFFEKLRLDMVDLGLVGSLMGLTTYNLFSLLYMTVW